MPIPLQAYSHPRHTPAWDGCRPCTPVDADGNILAFSQHWKIVLHPWQAHLGSCLVTARRHVERLGDLTQEEQTECFAIFSLLEQAIPQAFGAVHLNISCLMNLAFRVQHPDPPWRDGRPSPHVHWHVFPRYDRSVRFAGLIFTDPFYGAPLEIDRPMAVSQDVHIAIHRQLQAVLRPDLLG